jgi:hypothetical protein
MRLRKLIAWLVQTAVKQRVPFLEMWISNGCRNICEFSGRFSAKVSYVWIRIDDWVLQTAPCPF